jgi:hypothetical protein
VGGARVVGCYLNASIRDQFLDLRTGMVGHDADEKSIQALTFELRGDDELLHRCNQKSGIRNQESGDRAVRASGNRHEAIGIRH